MVAQSSIGSGGGEREQNILTPEEVKSTVRDFIVGRSFDSPIQKITDLTKHTIYKILKETDGISKSQIDKALDGLLEDKLIIKKEFGYTVYIPPNRLKNLSPDDKRFMTPTSIAQIFMGLYLLFIVLLIFRTLPDYLVNFFRADTNSNKFLIFSTIGVVFSYFVGKKVLDLSGLIADHTPTIMRYQNTIVPFVIILIPIVVILLVGVFMLNEKLNMTHFLTSLGIIVTGGIGWLNYKKGK